MSNYLQPPEEDDGPIRELVEERDELRYLNKGLQAENEQLKAKLANKQVNAELGKLGVCTVKELKC